MSKITELASGQITTRRRTHDRAGRGRRDSGRRYHPLAYQSHGVPSTPLPNGRRTDSAYVRCSRRQTVPDPPGTGAVNAGACHLARGSSSMSALFWAFGRRL